MWERRGSQIWGEDGVSVGHVDLGMIARQPTTRWQLGVNRGVRGKDSSWRLRGGCPCIWVALTALGVGGVIRGKV